MAFCVGLSQGCHVDLAASMLSALTYFQDLPGMGVSTLRAACAGAPRITIA